MTSLIVSAGAQQSYFGHDEFGRWAPGMKSVSDALELRGRILGAFEIAEAQADLDEARRWLTFAVVGGGPTGVELAGQIAELSRRSLRGNFRRIDPSSARVMLFEGGREILPNFGRSLSAKARRELERQGVEVNTETTVTGVDSDGIDVSGSGGEMRRVGAKTKVWAAGVEASPLARLLSEQSGAEVDKAGRVKVMKDCTLPGNPDTFAIGDMMALDDLPGVAEVAMQQGLYAARSIKRRIAGKQVSPEFHYRDLGSLATVSRFKAVASFGPLRFSGFIGWVLWMVVHLAFLTGFKNRLVALLHWAISFIGRGRVERAISSSMIESEQ